jgi:hypothetical protein
MTCPRRAAATDGKADRRTAARPSVPGAASRRLRTSSPAGVPTQALGADSSDRGRTCDRDVSGDSPKETVGAPGVDNDHGRRSEGDRRLTASHWSTWEMKRAPGSGALSNLPSPDPPIVNAAIYQTAATIWLPVCHTPRQSGQGSASRPPPPTPPDIRVRIRRFGGLSEHLFPQEGRSPGFKNVRRRGCFGPCTAMPSGFTFQRQACRTDGTACLPHGTFECTYLLPTSNRSGLRSNCSACRVGGGAH